VTATTTVLFAAANKARSLSAMAESLLPIFSIFQKKIITGMFNP
jgi:hypothetical protein